MVRGGASRRRRRRRQRAVGRAAAIVAVIIRHEVYDMGRCPWRWRGHGCRARRPAVAGPAVQRGRSLAVVLALVHTVPAGSPMFTVIQLGRLMQCL